MKTIQVRDMSPEEASRRFDEAWETGEGAILLDGDEIVCVKDQELGCGCPKCEEV